MVTVMVASVAMSVLPLASLLSRTDTVTVIAGRGFIVQGGFGLQLPGRGDDVEGGRVTVTLSV